MRKLSIAPLLFLIAMFLWTRFAAASNLPTTLPAKKKTVVVTTPVKKAATKKKLIVVDATPGLVKTLPAKKKVILNFDQPALPSAPAIVVREDATAFAPEAEAVVIQRHDVTEAPVLEFVGPEQQAPIEIPATAARTLRPALPDSDSFVELPEGLKRTAPQMPTAIATTTAAPVAPVVTTAPVAASTAAVAATTAPFVVSAAPIVISAPPVTAPQATATATATSQTTDASLSAQADTLAPALPEVTTSPEAIRDERATLSSTTAAPQLVGPPAPPVFDTSIVESKLSTKSTDLTAAEAGLDADKGTSDDRPAELKASTTFLVPSNESPRRRLFIRGGYLDAAYSKLESDLKNGATLFGVSASQVFSNTEVRLGIDFAYGLDQTVSLRNTRMAMFRAEGLYTLVRLADTASLYAGGALGLTDIQVTSFRSKNSNGDVTIRENAKGTALLGAPEIGSRINIGRQVSFDLSLQYLLLLGGDQISNLGGLLAEGALGFRF